jgi:hypothetical protein
MVTRLVLVAGQCASKDPRSRVDVLTGSGVEVRVGGIVGVAGTGVYVGGRDVVVGIGEEVGSLARGVSVAVAAVGEEGTVGTTVVGVRVAVGGEREAVGDGFTTSDGTEVLVRVETLPPQADIMAPATPKATPINVRRVTRDDCLLDP